MGYRNSYHFKLIFLFACFVIANTVIQAQDYSVKYFTPDQNLNRQLYDGEVDPITVFGISTNHQGLVINPKLKDGWTWMAVKDLQFQDENISYFFVDGWLYTTQSIFTSHRRQKFQRDVSDLVQGDVFIIAFYTEKAIEKELIIFIASENNVQGELTVSNKLWGEELKIPYQLNVGQGKYISVMKMADEFRPKFFAKPEVQTTVLNLNKNWNFYKNDFPAGFARNVDLTEWQPVDIPHCWNTQDVHDQRNEFDGYEIFPAYYRGPGWYRKSFQLPVDYSDKKVTVEFEGAFQVADVWLNENYLGKHVGGYTGFEFDISKYVKFGKNQNMLAVRVDNSYNYNIPPHTADYIMYGGLYRDVRLKITNPIHVKDVFVTTPEVSISTGKVKIKTTITNNTEKEVHILLKTNIVNEDGDIEATVKSRQTIQTHSTFTFEQLTPEIEQPELWHPDHPHLYNVYSTVFADGKAVHEQKTQFGFRWYSFDPNEGFFLNNEYLKLKGVNKHQDYDRLGIAVPDSLQIKDIKLIKEIGANFIRFAHYPHDPSVIEACDRLGIMVWAEIPFVNTAGGEKFAENAKQMMRELVRRDRNHLSVILWGISNESAMPFTNEEQIPQVIHVLEEVNKIAKQEDSTRLTIQAHNHLDDIRISNITDVIGRNRYYGWYGGKFDDFEKVMAKEHHEHPDWNIIISEYGVGAKSGYHVDNPVLFDFSEEYQLDFHEHYWKVIKERKWIAGSAVWNAFDFGSSVKRGNIPRINQKGIWDMARRPKDLYYFYKSQWTDEPMVYIVSHTRKIFHGKKNETKTIRVYSNCDEVELFLNGFSLGKKQQQYVYRWNVSIKPGKNRLKALAQKGIHFVEDAIEIQYLISEED